MSCGVPAGGDKLYSLYSEVGKVVIGGVKVVGDWFVFMVFV